MSNSEKKNKKRERQLSIVGRIAYRPVGYLVKHNISANLLSYLGFLSSLGAAISLGIGTTHNIWFGWLAPCLLIISGIFDVLDGFVARRAGTDSKAGAFLDSNLDRLSDAAIILGLVYGGLVDYFIGFILLFLSIMISYVRSRAENEGVDMKGVGLMERAERILFLWGILIAECWIYYLTYTITGTPFIWFFLFCILVYIFLLVYTIGQRLVFVFKKLSTIEDNKESSE